MEVSEGPLFMILDSCTYSH